MAELDAEVIVVGGGIVGLWSAYHLAKKGNKTLLIEQFHHPHTRGSSHGQSRITRGTYRESIYAAMMPENDILWENLERESKKTLLTKMGIVSIYDTTNKDIMQQFDESLANMRQYKPGHEVIEGKDLSQRFPGLACRPNNKAIFEHSAGVLQPGACIDALRNLILENGGTLNDGEQVYSISPLSDSKVLVTSSKRKYYSCSVIVACGPFTNKLLSTVNMHLPLVPVSAAVLYWRDTSSSKKYSLANGFPSISMKGSYYSIPSFEYPGLMKICYSAVKRVDPDRRDFTDKEIMKMEEDRMKSFRKEIKENFPEIDSSAPSIKEHCIFTKTPDEQFIVDFHPKFKNIIIGAGFSGHGFKTAPSVGLILANMALGKQESPGPFRISRFKSSKL